MSVPRRQRWWSKAPKTDTKNAPLCNGNCYSLVPTESAHEIADLRHDNVGSEHVALSALLRPRRSGDFHPPPNDQQSATSEEQPQMMDSETQEMSSEDCQVLSKVYQPISHGQTRLIRISPKSLSSAMLEVSIVTVDLVCPQGSRRPDTLEFHEYTALSYTLEDQTLMSELICNDLIVSLPLSLVSAIEYHQRSDRTSYLWICALCINQGDVQERAAQAAMAMDIFSGADSVTAWLGLPDAASDRAMRYIKDKNRLQAQLTIPIDVIHTPACRRAIQAHFHNLLSLYERPYLGRSWTRMETFAGRKVTVVCGRAKLRWQYFVHLGLSFLFHLRAVADPADIELDRRYSAIEVRLREALLTTDPSPNSMPVALNLLEALIRSQYYAVADDRDTVFSILGLCGVQMTTNPSSTPSSQALLVSYTRSLDQVYHDLSMWLINQDPKSFLTAWEYCVCPSSKSLPSWVIDWRASPCSNIDRLATDQIKADQLHDVYEWFPPSARLPPSYQSLTLSISDPGILTLQAQVTNHVAYITDITCPLDQFIRVSRKCSHHIWGGQAKDFHKLLLSMSLPRFEAARHNRRLAILGFSLDFQVALVPASTRAGDLVVAITPQSIPMILRPSLADSYKFSHEFTPRMDEKRWPIASLAIRRRQGWAMWADFSFVFVLFIVTWPFLALGRHYRDIMIPNSNMSGEGLCWIVYVGLIVITSSLRVLLHRSARKCCTQLLNRNMSKLDSFTEEHDCLYKLVGPALIRHGGVYHDMMDWKARSSFMKHEFTMPISLASRPCQEFPLH